MPENSGVYVGRLSQLESATMPRASTATPMMAIVRWASEKPAITRPMRWNTFVTAWGIRLASA